MRDLTVSDVERLTAAGHAGDIAFDMDEEAFGAIYERTAHSLGRYLSRLTGDRQLAEDLLQEAYYRFLRPRRPYESEAHQRNSLFRIATNLATDARRKPVSVALPDSANGRGIPVHHVAMNEQRTERMYYARSHSSNRASVL
jgi:RNA polymerase sigma-70 factor (ECF subfamily)